MKKLFMFLFLVFLLQWIHAQSAFTNYPVYSGDDLGLVYTKANSRFRIWSPPAEEAQLLLYNDGYKGDSYRTISLSKGNGGTWFAMVDGDLAGIFYTFRVKIRGKWSADVPDPYAKATGMNGIRALVADLKDTDPPGWENDKSPSFSKENKPTDAVIYELHIRDASIADNSGIAHKGKYLGLAETGTTSPDGLSTGLDHIKELGVTHIHLLPFYDYNSVDESQLEKKQYNWGYDPLNYNVPEGSYSTDPADGLKRITELKQMIASLHQQGLRVIMDVVYNHTAVTETSYFNQLVPGYYYRQRKDARPGDPFGPGSFSDASACGNETASERPMMRKFMLESVLYWVKEYHIDGFRFDLMGIHDIYTMNLISDELHKVKPDIVLYGEGWTAGDSPLPDSLRALKKNAHKLRNIAVFSDDLRDGIKGSVFDLNDRGFATGKPAMEESVKFGIVACGDHPQVDYKKVNYSKAPYTSAPWNVISYCECHDNNTLWDKINLSCPKASETDKEKMHRLALTIVLTSQGIPFLHAGTEFQRNKQGVENSYKSSDSINEMNWYLKKLHFELNQYVKELIQVRKAHPAFRMNKAEEVKKYIQFDKNAPAGTIIYSINGDAVKDPWKKIWIAFNGSDHDIEISLPDGEWNKAIENDGNQPLQSGNISISKYGSLILYQ